MKILLLNTNDSRGGAAKACYRLLQSLGAKAKLLVLEKKTEDNNQIYAAVSNRLTFFFYTRINKYLLRLKAIKPNTTFNDDKISLSLQQHPLVKEAELLHLHWINRGFISLNELGNLSKLNKPIVITLHDMWYFTGGCHFPANCNKYQNTCGACIAIGSEKIEDISTQQQDLKAKLYASHKLHFIAPSYWMQQKALASSLLKNASISVIKNGLDLNLYKPNAEAKKNWRKKQQIAPDTLLVLYGAESIADERKGFTLLMLALEKLHQLQLPFELIVFGNTGNYNFSNLPYTVHEQGYVSKEETLIQWYQIADILLMPSTEDNLPNVVLEAIGCGLPVVAFNQGGLPDLVLPNKTGLLATLRETEDFAQAIIKVNANLTELAQSCRKWAEEEISYEVIAAKHTELYQKLLR